VILDHLEGVPLHDVGPFRFGEVLRAGEGPRDVVLLPCLGCDASSWDEFMARNGDRYRMMAVTWPGLGDTALPTVVADPGGTPYYDYLLEALDLLIEREGFDRPVLVGHSAAAVLAVRYAAERPHRLSGVVNVDATVTNADTYGFSPEQRRAWADEEMADVLRRYDEDDAWARLNAAPSGMPAGRARFYELMWRTPPRANVFAYWRDWLRTDAGALLPGLSVPFLAIHALPSDSTRAAETRADLLARYVRAPMPTGGRIVLIEGSGHTVWEYRPEAFDEALADFVLGSELRAIATF
jgi:pimeloyl-ACP methyl ester carboxylesterase